MGDYKPMLEDKSHGEIKMDFMVDEDDANEVPFFERRHFELSLFSRTLSFYERLSFFERSLLGEACKIIKFKKGATMVKEGHTAYFYCFILDGEAEVTVEGMEATIAV